MDRASDLRHLAEHLTAAFHLGIACGMAHELATFPVRTFRQIVVNTINHEAPPAFADPTAHPTPDQT